MISIVIPCYNEENRIANTLQEFRSLRCDVELIIVSDGSTDRTVEVAQREWPEVKIISHEINRGKGYSIRRGVLEATGDVVCIMDADGAAPPTELLKLLGAMNGNTKIVIGTRPMDRKPLRLLMGKSYGSIVRMVTGLKFRDTQCGLKIFSKEAAQAIFRLCRVNGFGIDVEALLLANVMGFKTVQTPIAWREVPGSKVNIIRDSWRMLNELFIALETVRRMSSLKLEAKEVQA